MERRTFIAGAAAAAATLATKAVLAQEHDHSKHAAGKDAKGPAGGAPVSKERQAVIDTTADCMKAGEVCLAHCTDNIAGGNKDMASCQRAVMNMLAVCRAMFAVASYGSADAANIKALAKACSAYCTACAKACEAHAGHHWECKNCMESCKACAKACDALAK